MVLGQLLERSWKTFGKGLAFFRDLDRCLLLHAFYNLLVIIHL